MSEKVTVPLLNVTIRRDANTITPTTVPKHELAILRMMFGKENVQETGTAGTVDVDPEGEHERLSAKYGSPKIIKVYGDDNGERLSELVMRDVVQAPKEPKVPAEPKATSAKAPKEPKVPDATKQSPEADK